jgi:crotonobetainyl-CoA:carnitine CoA-transferase CaiB-like acyl-CoA transferase
MYDLAFNLENKKPMVSAPALEGILIADFSRVLAGPLATMTLGDLGAEIIKVERPDGGDDTRSWGPPWTAGASTYYLTANRNKKSVCLDLSLDSDRQMAFKLAQRADVLVENFMPGSMEKWGLGYEQIRGSNPRLIYCSITGFGSTGEASKIPGYDFVVQAMSGIMSITGESNGPPLKIGAALIDMICGLYATTGILAALNARHKTGAGQLIEVSLMDAALTSLLNQGSAYLNTGVSPLRHGNQHPSIAPYQLYTASDKSFVIAVGSDGTWRRLCQAIDAIELVDDIRFLTNSERIKNLGALNAILEKKFLQRTANEWIDLLTANAVPSGAVNNIEEGFLAAEKLGLNSVVTTIDSAGNSIKTVRSPIKISEMTNVTNTAPPSLGEQNDAIRQWLSN